MLHPRPFRRGCVLLPEEASEELKKRAKWWLPIAVGVVAVLALAASQASAGNGIWTTGGPEGGITRAIIASPNVANDGIVFAAAQGRGVLKSSDRGATWTVSNSGMGNADVRAFAISPSFAGDHTVFAASLGGGLFRSNDSGASWTALNNGLASQYLWGVAVSPQFASDRTVFAASDDRGVFRSTNSGDTWLQTSSGMTLTSVMAIAISPDYANDHTVLAACQGGLFRSNDGGASWVWAAGGLARADLRSVVFSPAYATDGTAFVGTEMGGVYKTTNRAQSWFYPSNSAEPADISGLAVSPNYANDHTIYTANFTYGYSKSVDGGTVWVHHASFGWLPFTSNPDGISIAISPNYTTDGTVWAGSFGTGIFRTQNRAQSWQLLRSGYYAARTDRVAASPSYASDHTVFTWALGGGLYGSSDGGQTWRAINSIFDQHLLFGLIGAIGPSPNFANDQTIFVSQAEPWTVARSTNGGAWWERADTGIPTYDVVSLALSPAYTSDGTLFAASSSSGIFRSTNRGVSWTAANSGLPTLQIGHVIVSPAFASDRTVFATNKGGGVFKSSDAGATWQVINSGLSSLSVCDIAISPAYASDQTVFVCTGSGVFRSSNGGASWSLVKTIYSLKSVAISARYAEDGTVYAGGINGIIRSSDRGQTWSDISAGLGQISVTEMSTGAEATGHTLFVATVGGGVWQYSSGGAPPVATSTPTQSPAGTSTRTPTRTPSITPTPAAPPVGAGPYRLNAGGGQYVDTIGRAWRADQAYSAGGFGYVGGQTYAVTAAIDGTDDDPLFQTERWGMSTYKFDVPNGAYRVELLFDEIYDARPGIRVFDVRIQGQTVLANFCPGQVAGGLNKALRYLYQANVSNGQLVIDFVARSGPAKISAISVESPDAPVTSTATPTAADTATATAVPSSTPTTALPNTRTATATATATQSATATPTPSRTATQTQTTTSTATYTPASLPSSTATLTRTATRTSTATQPAAGTIAYRVNAGGPRYVDIFGRTWLADQAYTAGGFGYVGGQTYVTGAAISGTQDPTLYQTERWGLSAYKFDLPNGAYRVELLIDEIYDARPGIRVFDVLIQGQTVLANFCPGQVAGGLNKALRYLYLANVSNGQLIVSFVARNGPPKINAIGVESVDAPGTATVTPTAVDTATATATPTQTSSPTMTATATATLTPTETPWPTVTATPSNTATATSTATVTQPTGSPTATPTARATYDVGVNGGGNAYAGADGKQWLADQQYQSGSWGYQGGKIFATGYAISGTLDDTLYQSERWGMTGYSFDVAAGTYNVQFKFAEIYGWKAGQRLFDVQIEGQTVISNLDIFATVGRYTAFDRSFLVQVTDGKLDIAFVARVDAPKINAIRVTQALAP